ncbi:MAG TPA: class I SAM-dependent RNA methyltransferase [Terriglobales bacterium]
MHLTIEKLIYGGDGLARLPADERGRGKAVFVPFVLENEEVEAILTEQKPGFAKARLDSVIQPSPSRIDPGCPYFQRCGGCHYQHTAFAHQLEIKAAILKENLRRIAKLDLTSDLQIHSAEPWYYRNRTRLKVRSGPDFALGYYKFNSHDLLPIDRCPISSPLINHAIKAVTAAEPPLVGIHEIEFFANADDKQLLLELYCAPGTPPETAQTAVDQARPLLPEISGVVAFTNQPEPQRLAAAGASELSYITQHATYRVSAGAFFQTNRHLTDELISIAIADQKGATALDLYAGGGLFSSVLSRNFERVVAVESSLISHADLRYNSPANVKVVRGMVDQYLRTVSRKLHPDLVVVDPPRGGLGESVVHTLVTLGAPRITYVSCDPATLSRDLGGLLKSGYKVERAHLVDLFPQTYHLETVFHLKR